MASRNTPVETKESAPERNVLQIFNNELAFRARMDADSPAGEANRARSIENILTAETDDEFWNADDRESISGPDLLDVEQRIISFVVKKSNGGDAVAANIFKDENGGGLYLEVSSVRLDTGEEIVWNTSAPGLVAKIVGLEKRSMLPCDCVIRGFAAANGTVLKLKPVPKRAIPGTTSA